jgi:hypothetical protein
MKRVISALVSTLLVAFGSLALLPAQNASAATTFTWSGNGDAHTWTNPQNWTPSDGTPQDGDTVTIDGNWTINSVPTISLESLSMSGPEMLGAHGPILVGPNSTITTKLLTWSGRGSLAASLVVTQAGQLSNITAPGPTLDNSATALGNPPVTFTNNGLTSQVGAFGLTAGPGSGAQIINNGTWHAVGETTIASGNCCGASTGVIDNHGTITVAGKLVLDHAKFVAEQNSEFHGLPGTIEVRGGSAQLLGPWSINGGAKLQLTSNAEANIGGTTKVGGEIQQEQASKITGTGTFDGRGKYRWLGGQILANLTLGSSLTGVVEGASLPNRELSSGIGGGVLTVEGKVNQTADVLMNGKIVNNGTWHVPTDTHTTVGAGGLGTPPKQFRNAGTIKVDSGAELSLKLLELSNPTDKGVIEGGGMLFLSGGIHQLSDGGSINGPGTKLKLVDGAEVHASGTLKLDQARVQVENAELWGTSSIGGNGTTVFVRGTIVGDLTTGKDVSLILPVDPGPIILDGATGAGILRTKGDVRQNHPEQISMLGDAEIQNSGTWLMDHANFEGEGENRFVNEGKLTVTESGSAKFSVVRFVNTGFKSHVLVDDRATAEFTGISPRVISDGLIELRRSRIVTELPLVLAGGSHGGALMGKGGVHGDVTNGGNVDPGRGNDRGTLHVSGEYRQLTSGTLFMDIFSSGSDEIVAGALALDGALHVSNEGSEPLQRDDRLLLSATDSRSGKFETVTGLRSLDGGWSVKYDGKNVVLHHR